MFIRYFRKPCRSLCNDEISVMYHVNYGAIQGFLALRKAVTTHSKKYHIF